MLTNPRMPSLTTRTDEELLRLAQEGFAPATEQLLVRYKPLVESKARSYFLLGGEPDDLVQEGMIGLYKAVRDYREQRLALFRAFADLCVTRQILTAIKTASRCKHTPLNSYISLYQPPSSEVEAEGYLLDTLPDPRSCDPQELVLGSRGSQGLDAVRRMLSHLERKALDAYLEGKSYYEMAAEMRCLPKTIDNALQRARRKIEASFALDSLSC